MHDQTAVKPEGIADLFQQHPTVTATVTATVDATVDAGYRGLAKAFGDQVCAPPPKPSKDAPAEEITAWQQARKQQSSRRICVEHANADAEHQQWRPLQRYTGRREHYAETHLAIAETHLAIAGLVCDRAARRHR